MKAAEVEKGTGVLRIEFLDPLPRAHQIFERRLVAIVIFFLQVGDRIADIRRNILHDASPGGAWPMAISTGFLASPSRNASKVRGIRDEINAGRRDTLISRVFTMRFQQVTK
jgi:hypothetical protein